MSEVKFHHAGLDFSLQTWAEDDCIHQHLATQGSFYEEQILAFIRSRGLRGTYLDVGANIGNHAVYFATLCQPSLVVAMEGNPAILPLLRDNLQANRPPALPVWLMPGFISTKPELYFTQAADDNVGSSYVSSTAADQSARPSRAWPLDAICASLPRIDLLKIDVEGHEFEVLQSGVATLRRDHPDICVESFEQTHGQLQQWLADLGYLQFAEFRNYNWYFVHVGSFAVRVHRALRQLPFAWHSRLRWRWVALAGRLARLVRRPRTHGAPAVPATPPPPLCAL